MPPGTVRRYVVHVTPVEDRYAVPIVDGEVGHRVCGGKGDLLGLGADRNLGRQLQGLEIDKAHGMRVGVDDQKERSLRAEGECAPLPMAPVH